MTLSDGQSYPLSRVLTFICNPSQGNSITNVSKAALQAFHVEAFNDEQFSRLTIDDISMTTPRDLEQVSLDLMSVRRSYNDAQYEDVYAWQAALCSVFRHHYAEAREMTVFCFVLNE